MQNEPKSGRELAMRIILACLLTSVFAASVYCAALPSSSVLFAPVLIVFFFLVSFTYFYIRNIIAVYDDTESTKFQTVFFVIFVILLCIFVIYPCHFSEVNNTF